MNTSIQEMLGMEPGSVIKEVRAKVWKAWPPRKDGQMVSLSYYDFDNKQGYWMTAMIAGCVADFSDHIKEMVTITGGSIVLQDNEYQGTHTNQLRIEGAEVSFGDADSSGGSKGSQQADTSSSASPQSRQTSSNDGLQGAARDKSIITQAYLKSIIESGAPEEEWEKRLIKALEVHKKLTS